MRSAEDEMMIRCIVYDYRWKEMIVGLQSLSAPLLMGIQRL